MTINLDYQTFKQWFNDSFEDDDIKDIADRGADQGYQYITYTSDTVEIFDRFGNEIWDMAVEDAEDMGCKNVAEMISSFNRADMLCTLDSFKNLMVWYACEKLARDKIDEVD